MASLSIDPSDDATRWRWTCPDGHAAWQPASDATIWCSSCARTGDRDPTYSLLRDKKTGRLVAVSDVDYRD